LQVVHAEIEKDGAFADADSAGAKFLKRVLPARYEKIGFSVGELTNWMRRRLGDAPSRWLADGRLHEEVEAFVKQGYDADVRKKAVEKVQMLSDGEAKTLFLKLIDRIPDAGLLVLE
jgi:hypothetical protein